MARERPYGIPSTSTREERPGLSTDMDLLSLTPTQLDAILGAATPEERAELAPLVEHYHAMRSPAGFAARASKGSFDPSPKHIQLIDEHLVALAEGRIRKLIITLPPRHGKSWLCSKYLPAWYLARYPDRKVILASYEATFAANWGGEARDALYDAADWCGVTVRSDSKAKDQWRIAGHQGVMFTAGRGGRTTGLGAHLFVIDDPFKNSEEADSEAIRQSCWDWYLTVATTRMETPPEWTTQGDAMGSQLVIHTRWHEDDLIGRLEETQPGQWTVINLPALAEDGDDALGREPGEALWPERYPANALEHIRQNYIEGEGIRWWWALFQQRPSSVEGDEFSMPSLRYYDLINTGDGPTVSLDGRLVPLKRTLKFGTMDVAMSLKTRADWTVLSTWAATRDFPTDLLWLDCQRDRVQSGAQVAMLERGIEKHRPQFVGIEDKSYGTNLLQESARRRLAVRPLKAESDKITRAQPAASLLSAGRLWLPRAALPWRDVVESELTAFPNGKHDDTVDTLSYAAILAESRRLGKKPKDEPMTPEERMQRWIAERSGKRKRGSRSHPVLGRI